MFKHDARVETLKMYACECLYRVVVVEKTIPKSDKFISAKNEINQRSPYSHATTYSVAVWNFFFIKKSEYLHFFSYIRSDDIGKFVCACFWIKNPSIVYLWEWRNSIHGYICFSLLFIWCWIYWRKKIDRGVKKAVMARGAWKDYFILFYILHVGIFFEIIFSWIFRVVRWGRIEKQLILVKWRRISLHIDFTILRYCFLI